MAAGPVMVVPTGAAYERPDRVIDEAVVHFGSLGAKVEPVMVLRRADAENTEIAAAVRGASFVYLCGGSPLHLRSVLKDSQVLDAMVAAWRDGAIIAGLGAGTVALTDPMVDPRGGAYTVGLGFVRNLAAVPGGDGSTRAGLRRTISLLPVDCALVELPPDAAAIRSADGTWRAVGDVSVYSGRQPAGLEALAGKSVW
jgi:cyanophycinase